ncbi:MAG: hypothetical protein RBU30_08090 [Polyangia bacterium]|jgi:hypothetical protein|nr:hypothetical protein [Polyangia bacterium]
MSRRFKDSFRWQPVPICFACGKELGTEVRDVLYMGWGVRDNGKGPAWVTTLCPCGQGAGDGEQACSCAEIAREFASRAGQELSAEEYQEWLETA